MNDTSSARKVTLFRMTPATAERRIRECAQDSGNVNFSKHALERMNIREIFDSDVLKILRRGMVCDYPEATTKGEWKCKVTMKLRGMREAGVVLIILKPGGLLIKTVEWEDLS